MAATMRKKGGKYVVTVCHNGKRQQKTYDHKRKAEAAVTRTNRQLASGEFEILEFIKGKKLSDHLEKLD